MQWYAMLSSLFAVQPVSAMHSSNSSGGGSGSGVNGRMDMRQLPMSMSWRQ
jgi:hypothetical protein